MPLSPTLVAELQSIVGKPYVLYRPEDLIVFEFDGSIDKGVPSAVVLPDSTEQVAGVMRACRAAGVSIAPRGAGTGLSGGAIPLGGSVTIALTRMNRILEIDVENRMAVVQPGVINLHISQAVDHLGLFYAPDPSSQKACSIGGNVAENSGGPHCLFYGATTNHILATEVVLADGTVTWLGDRTGHAPGYDLRGVFIGSEGTLGIATTIVVRLLPKPETVRTMLAVYDTVDDASGTVSDIIGGGVLPAAMEMLDALGMKAVNAALNTGYPGDAGAVLLIEVEGLLETVVAEAEWVMAACRGRNAREVRLAETQAERDRLWAGRKGALGAMGQLAPNYYTLDGVVPRTKLPEVLRRIAEVSARSGILIPNIFHAGDGNLHPCIVFDEREPGIEARVLKVGEEVMRICVDAGGALSGEHGIGIEKQDFMDWIFNAQDLAAMAKLRPAFGSDDLLNPGKIFPGARLACGESGHGRANVKKVMAAGGYL
ncbi:MAG: FAD-binding protein [Dehalococcoidia bacterium]|nr:FAD-binding protein [Dehalococcoidia bacterium]